jgi:K+/H+ antiporter YhaU regulatory subunit KhtT
MADDMASDLAALKADVARLSRAMTAQTDTNRAQIELNRELAEVQAGILDVLASILEANHRAMSILAPAAVKLGIETDFIRDDEALWSRLRMKLDQTRALLEDDDETPRG